MPRKKAAIKELKKSQKRHDRNTLYKKALKHKKKQMAGLISAQDTETARKELSSYFSTVDTSVVKGIIHKNKAAREKSRIMKRISRLGAKAKPAS